MQFLAHLLTSKSYQSPQLVGVCHTGPNKFGTPVHHAALPRASAAVLPPTTRDRAILYSPGDADKPPLADRCQRISGTDCTETVRQNHNPFNPFPESVDRLPIQEPELAGDPTTRNPTSRSEQSGSNPKRAPTRATSGSSRHDPPRKGFTSPSEAIHSQTLPAISHTP